MLKVKSEYADLDKYKSTITGTIVYYKKDTHIYHNPYGPAIIYKDGYKAYWIEGKVHKLDGPAVIFSDGEGQYWISDKYLTKEQFEVHPERLKHLGKDYLICLI